jgi:hypothetical protein
VTDWLNEIPPEWLLVMWCAIMAICLGALLIVLVWATSPERYKGTRRVDRPAHATPYEARPHYPRGKVTVERAIRIAPYVTGNGHGRHAAPEEVPPMGWAPPRRDTAGA